MGDPELRLVRVTWRSDGAVYTEVVQLLSDKDEIYAMGLNDSGALGIVEDLLGTDTVLFEDDEGVFGLRPSDIISIERVSYDEP